MNNSKVEFVDTSKECINTMTKYAKSGLRAGGKIVTKIIKDDIKNNHYKTGGLYKSVAAVATMDKKTGQPYLKIGYLSKKDMLKKGIKYYVNPYWFEYGIKAHQIQTKALTKYGKSTYELQNYKGQKYGVIVQHPGQNGNNFLRNTVYEHIEEIRNAENEWLEKITELKIEKGLYVDLEGEEEVEG